MKHVLAKVICVVVMMLFCITNAHATETEESQFPYVISEGSSYHEISWGFGTGRTAEVSEENPFTEIPCYVQVDGYAALDSDGRVLEADYQPGKSYQLPDVFPENTSEVFVHVQGDYRLGWTDMDNLIPSEENAQQEQQKISEGTGQIVVNQQEETPEEVVQKILDISIQDETANTILVIDFSGSMAPHQAEVVKKLEELSLDTFDSIWVFATTCEEVTQKELISRSFEVGELTHLHKSLDGILAKEANVNNIILISDLLCMDYDITFELQVLDRIQTVTIYDTNWYTNSTDPVDDEKVLAGMAEAWPSAEIIWTQIAQ